MNLSAGVYTVVVTDANGCTATASATLTEPTALTLTAMTLDADCAGFATGSGTLTSSGGVGPYTFDLSTGETVGPQAAASALFTTLSAGGYIGAVTDANGCVEVVAFEINDPKALEASIDTATHVSCNGLSDGTATVVASGSSGTYNYLWEDGQTTATATGLPAGTHTVTVSDPNGVACDVIVSVLITEPTLLIAEIIDTEDETCPQADDGTATVNATGGTTGYTYAWSNGDATHMANNLMAGVVYTVTVTDANACTATATATVNEPDTLIASIDAFTVCNDANMQIDLTQAFSDTTDLGGKFTFTGGTAPGTAGTGSATASINGDILSYSAPATTGDFTFDVTYTVGEGVCAVSDIATISVQNSVASVQTCHQAKWV